MKFLFEDALDSFFQRMGDGFPGFADFMDTGHHYVIPLVVFSAFVYVLHQKDRRSMIGIAGVSFITLLGLYNDLVATNESSPYLLAFALLLFGLAGWFGIHYAELEMKSSRSPWNR